MLDGEGRFGNLLVVKGALLSHSHGHPTTHSHEHANTSTQLVVQRSSRFKNNCFTVLRSGSEEVSHLRLVDFCITQL